MESEKADEMMTVIALRTYKLANVSSETEVTDCSLLEMPERNIRAPATLGIYSAP
jgi:hypothetical protein